MDTIETATTPGTLVVATMPHGPFTDALQRQTAIKRGHVHQFESDELAGMFGAKAEMGVSFMHHGQTRRGI